jgi:hypothetical protein
MINRFQSVKAADQEERRLANNYNLPPDPLVELELQDHINLPLVAFAYTLRRFMVRTLRDTGWTQTFTKPDSCALGSVPCVTIRSTWTTRS